MYLTTSPLAFVYRVVLKVLIRKETLSILFATLVMWLALSATALLPKTASAVALVTISYQIQQLPAFRYALMIGLSSEFTLLTRRARDALTLSANYALLSTNVFNVSITLLFFLKEVVSSNVPTNNKSKHSTKHRIVLTAKPTLISLSQTINSLQTKESFFPCLSDSPFPYWPHFSAS